MTAPRWYDVAVDRIEEAHEKGDMSYEAYRAELRVLNEDLKEFAQEAARDIYDDLREW